MRQKYLFAALAAVASTCVNAAEIWVNSEADGIDPMACTLRAAIESANNDSAVAGCSAGDGVDVIWLAANVQTIELTAGPLHISSSLELRHANQDSWVLDGMASSRVLEVDTDGHVTIVGASITGGEADSGGGLRVDGGALLWLEDVDVHGNVASFGGGGVEIRRGAVLLLNSIIRNNQADSGGGVVIAGSPNGLPAELVLYDSEISGNQATVQGGGIEVSHGDLFVTNSLIGHNSATWGGGIHAYDAWLEFFDSHIEHNQAEQGGGLALAWAERFLDAWPLLRMESSSVRYNHAETGGGVFVRDTTPDGGQAVRFDGLQILGNEATVRGGGLALHQSIVNLDNAMIANNQVVTNGDDGHGGGISLTGGSQVMLSDCAIVGNSAPTGGGVHVQESVEPWAWLGLDFCLIAGNTALRGGGVAQAGDFAAFGTVIEHNHAGVGGGLYSTNEYLYLSDATIRHNSAEYGGGVAGVFEESPQPGWGFDAFSMTTIHGNQGEVGGGMYLETHDPAGDRLELAQLQIFDNQATRLGGGIAITQGNVRIEDSLVEGNVVTGSTGGEPSGGGGIAITSSGEVVLAGVAIRNNTAPTGGGLLVASPEGPIWGHVLFMDGELVENSADSGGGVAILSGELAVWSSQLASNQANNGGGIDVSGGSLYLDDMALENNSAANGGGIAFRLQESPPPWEMAVFWSTTIRNNQAEIGGGVYVELLGGPFGQPFRLSGVIVEENLADLMGGGMAFVGENFELSDVTVIANIAEEGGGMHFHGEKLDQSTISNSDLIFNQARRGGAVAVRDQYLHVIDTTVSGNTASLEARGNDDGSGQGGGAWVTGGAVWFEHAAVSSNLAESSGGGIYLQESFGVVDSSSIIANSGGGIDVQGGVLVVGYANISGNHGGPVGGLRCASCDQMEVYHSSVTDNSGQHSGGIEYRTGSAGRGGRISPFYLINSTISGNSGGQAGGVRADDIRIDHSTIAFNARIPTASAVFGMPPEVVAGGIAVTNAPVIRNSIIAANQAPDGPADLNVYAYNHPGVADMSFTLVQDSSGFTSDGQGNRFGLDPGLLPLALNGAAISLSHALQVSSPAIHNADPAFAPPPNFDQRGPGFPRLSGARLDMGAFESSLEPVPLLSDEALDFGLVRVHQSGEALTLSLSNAGDGALTMGEVWLSDAAGGVFELLEENCSEQILAPAASCQVSIGFMPDQPGPFQGKLSLANNSASSPVVALLQGLGGQSMIQITPQSHDFGQVIANHGSADREITVENTGEFALSIESVIGPEAPFELAGTDVCSSLPVKLPPGDACSFELVFAPTTIEVFEQTIGFTSDADSGQSSITIFGTGTDTAIFGDRFEKHVDSAPEE